MSKTFEIQKITAKDTNLLYAQILNMVLGANTNNKTGRQTMHDAILLYVNYVANRRGIECKYSFRDDNQELTKEEIESLKRTDEEIDFAQTDATNKHILFSSNLLNAKTVDDFALFVSVIEHEFEHLATKKEKNYFTFSNPNGLKMEFINHKNALQTIQNYVATQPNLTPDERFGNEMICGTYFNALSYVDDLELTARLTGMEAQRMFLKNLKAIAQKQGIEFTSENAIDLKLKSIILDEQNKNSMQHQILKENNKDMHKMLFELSELAIQENNTELLLALAETQDIKELYNPVIYKFLDKYSEKNKIHKLSVVLDNSKYAQISPIRARHDLVELMKQSPEHVNVDNLLFNFDEKHISKWKHHRSQEAENPLAHKPTMIEKIEDNLLEKQNPEGKTIMARELLLETKDLSPESKSYLAKLTDRAKRVGSRFYERNEEIVDLEEKTRGRKKIEPVMVADEIPETTYTANSTYSADTTHFMGKRTQDIIARETGRSNTILGSDALAHIKSLQNLGKTNQEIKDSLSPVTPNDNLFENYVTLDPDKQDDIDWLR